MSLVKIMKISKAVDCLNAAHKLGNPLFNTLLNSRGITSNIDGETVTLTHIDRVTDDILTMQFNIQVKNVIIKHNRYGVIMRTTDIFKEQRCKDITRRILNKLITLGEINANAN